jgi:hypothetical protein
MPTIIEKKIVNSYFRFMKNWDNQAKKDMIIKLTESIDNQVSNGSDFSLCFGGWDDVRSADEIINEIHSDRVNNKEIEKF